MSGPEAGRGLVPAGFGEDEFTEKRSRFIGRLWRADTEEEAMAHLKEIRALDHDARHHVWAYLLPGGKERCSDDGEPQGTGGVPVLEVLRRAGLSSAMCIVTRYFGGVLLGAGGLTRAYARGASMAIEAAGVAELRLWRRLEASAPYRLYERIVREAAECGGIVDGADFGQTVRITVFLPDEAVGVFSGRLTELSGGQLSAEDRGGELRAFPFKK